MRHQDFIRHSDILALENSLFEIPLRKEFILKHIGRGKRVLDLGCLGGRFSKLIHDQNNEVHGVELNSRAAEAAKSQGIQVKVFDLNDGIPFEDAAFDVIHGGQVFEHVFDTKALLEECSRVLRRDGMILLTLMNLNSIENRLKVLGGGYLSGMGGFPEDHHGQRVRLFNFEKLQELCGHSGFNVEEYIGVPNSTRSRRYFALRPLVKFLPRLGELLVVKLRKIED